MDKRSLEFVREILKMECPERRFVEPGSIGNMTASIRSATLYTGQSGGEEFAGAEHPGFKTKYSVMLPVNCELVKKE